MVLHDKDFAKDFFRNHQGLLGKSVNMPREIKGRMLWFVVLR